MMSIPKIAVKAEMSTVNSNMIGKNAGTVKRLVGLPITMRGKMNELGMNWIADRCHKARKTAKEDDLAEYRMLQAHRCVHPVNWEWREDIKPRKACITHLFSGVKKLASSIEFGGDSVERQTRDFQRRFICILMFSPIMRVSFRKNCLDFEHANHRQETDEE